MMIRAIILGCALSVAGLSAAAAQDAKVVVHKDEGAKKVVIKKHRPVKKVVIKHHEPANKVVIKKHDND